VPASASAISQLALGVAATTIHQRSSARVEGSDAEMVAALREATGVALQHLVRQQMQGYEDAARNASRWLRVLGEAQSTLLETSARLRYDAARRLAVAIEANDARWVSGAPGRSGGATGPSRGARAGSRSTRQAVRGV
jgi:hypothetical protein